jgi:hypothetical protein
VYQLAFVPDLLSLLLLLYGGLSPDGIVSGCVSLPDGEQNPGGLRAAAGRNTIEGGGERIA